MRIILVIASVLVFNFLEAQNYGDIPVKEEYDLYNTYEVNVDHILYTIGPNNDANTFGDGMSKILEGYIAMYKATNLKTHHYEKNNPHTFSTNSHYTSLFKRKNT